LEENNKSLDILGIKPISEAISHVTKSTVDGAAAFLGRVCLPAAEEFGLMLQDKVKAWRSNNAVAILAAAERKLSQKDCGEAVAVHPRMVFTAMENGSWTDCALLHEMWGGVLASSASADGKDDSNLIYTTILSQLTSSQAKIIAYACEVVGKRITPPGLIFPEGNVFVKPDELLRLSGSSDVHVLDVELDRLRSLDLIASGFSYGQEQADITPTALALNMYVRCQGYRGSAIEYFGVPSSEKDENSDIIEH